MLPNIAGVLIVQVTIQLALAILTEAGLSYLGLGIRPPNPSWGRMLSDAQTYLSQAPHLAIAPGVAIAVSVLGLNLLGDGLRDALDPTLRGRGALIRSGRPRPLWPAQVLEGAAEAQHPDIVEPPPDDLQADRQAGARVACIDRSCRLLRHVEGDRVADMLERPFRIVDRRGQLRREGRNRRHRRQTRSRSRGRPGTAA